MVYRANEMNVRQRFDRYIVNLGFAAPRDIQNMLMGSTGVFAAHDQIFNFGR